MIGKLLKSDCLFKELCKWPIFLAKAICSTSSTHRCLVEPDTITKESHLVTGTVVRRARTVNLVFDATNLFKYIFFQSHSSPYSHLIPAENDFFLLHTVL